LKEVAAAQRVARFCTAQVLDAGIFERRPFIVNEYVDGPSLVEVVEQFGPRRGAALERIAIATLTALGAVHAVGMVHRDFKPANVLLGPDGPIVIDFGLATVPGMTTTGLSGQVAIGTPAYMAPEQLAGERVTAAADMWSWGVTIAFAGTGLLLFKGESLTATAYAILHSDPQVGALPEPLGLLVRRCLNKDSALRPSARDALNELVAAGARLIGPIPPLAVTLRTKEETAGSKTASAAPPGSPPAAQPGPRHRSDGLGSGRPASRRRSLWSGSGRVRWRWRAAALVTVILLAGAAGLAFTFSSRDAPPRRQANSQQLAAEGAARRQAISWILRQVSPAAGVSCDSQVCAGLANKGFPNAYLLRLSSMSSDPVGSSLVVATSDVRAQFGGRLASVYAPAIIASFGSGAARIEIRLVYPGGAKAYRAVQEAALRARKAADAQLLTNPNLKLPATAITQLRGGQIDPRLAALIALMTGGRAGRKLRIVDFSSESPGGGPASLLRWVDLATAVPAAHLTRLAYVRWMLGYIHAQQAPFRPTWARQVTLRGGQTALRIGYGAPSPLRWP
jgi:hypothetical protein